MPPVINVHTHFQPSGTEQALEPLGLTWLTNADASFTFRAGKVEHRMPPPSKRNEGFFGANLHTRLPAMPDRPIFEHWVSEGGVGDVGQRVPPVMYGLGTPPVDPKTGKVVEPSTAEV